MKTKTVTYTVVAKVRTGVDDNKLEKAIELNPNEFFNLKVVKIKDIAVEVDGDM